MDEARLQKMFDRAEIEETAMRMGQGADRRDWEDLVACFTDEIRRDYTSLTGGDPDGIVARKLVTEEWAPALGSLDATQHFIGPCTISVKGDRATAHSYFQAKHVLAGADSGEKWTLGGRYDWDLVRTAGRWRISGVTMTAMWDEGNRDLMAQAAARASRGRSA